MYNTHLMISEYTHEALPPGIFRIRVLDVIKVKGKSKPVKVFEVYGESCFPLSPEDETYYSTYNEAFELFLARDFDRASERFQTALSLRPDDPASSAMVKRIDEVRKKDLPPDCNGCLLTL
jgi:adenylate cyclase